MAIQTASVTQVPGSTEYALTVATTGDPATGPLVFLVTDPATGAVSAGDAERAAAPGRRRRDGQLRPAGSPPPHGYTVLNGGQASARSQEITDVGGADRAAGRSARRGCRGRTRAGPTGRTTPGATASGTPTTGRTWTADEQARLVRGRRRANGWPRAGGSASGLRNFTRVVTDPAISGPFLRTLVWNFAFALGSTGGTFVLGLLCALALHSPPGARARRSTGCCWSCRTRCRRSPCCWSGGTCSTPTSG